MGVKFGCKFDNDLNETCSGTAADINQGVVLNTSIYKFGGGSVYRNGAAARRITWLDFPFLSGNSGTVGFWARDGAASSHAIEIDINDSPATNNNDIAISILSSLALYDTTVTMTDNAGVSTVSMSLLGAPPFSPSNVWVYYELNWLWNSGGGITEMTRDGIVLLSSTGGNGSSRLGSVDSDVSLRLSNNDHIDDFVVLPDRQHTGNFAVPTASQVVCTAGQISFGSQMNRFGAGFSR